MRYPTESKYRNYVRVYRFLSFATKTWIDASKTASKRVVPKTGEATGDLIRNKIADKNTSADNQTKIIKQRK